MSRLPQHDDVIHISIKRLSLAPIEILYLSRIVYFSSDKTMHDAQKLWFIGSSIHYITSGFAV